MAEQVNGTKAVATIERRPMGLFERLEREMEEMRRQMFGFFPRPALVRYRPVVGLEAEWAPTADAYEKDGTFVVKAELPGVKADDVTVNVDAGVLTIQGKREDEKETKDARYHAAERFTGTFNRTFALPEGVDTGKIEATFKDGVLEVRVPLPAATKPATVTIPVKG